jgi:predicted DsbA family dithiol-disulfide isomerase
MNAAVSPPIPIDLVGDVASAECFIGLRLIGAVVASVPGLSVDVRWRPFQVDPDLPSQGQDRAAYLEQKYGSPQDIQEALDALADAGREVGVAFAFDAIERQPNTFEAHRLVRFARDFNAEIRMVKALFRAFFIDGQDIGDRGVLAALAARTGLDRRRVGAFLDGDGDLEALRQELTGFRALGVEDVPRFVIGGKQTIVGIVPAEDFADALFGSIEDD